MCLVWRDEKGFQMVIDESIILTTVLFFRYYNFLIVEHVISSQRFGWLKIVMRIFIFYLSIFTINKREMTRIFVRKHAWTKKIVKNFYSSLRSSSKQVVTQFFLIFYVHVNKYNSLNLSCEVMYFFDLFEFRLMLLEFRMST